ncbi:MAG: toll/interleukin-1 receptor domain-containing protein, partial [Patescibacteria group bacterium]
MAYSIFLSHSMTPEDEPLVRTIADQLASLSINCYIAERDPKYGQPLAHKVENALRTSDCLVAVLTKGGAQSSYVNQEIGLAVGLNKPIIPIVEKEVDLRGLRAGVEWIEFDRNEP